MVTCGIKDFSIVFPVNIIGTVTQKVKAGLQGPCLHSLPRSFLSYLFLWFTARGISSVPPHLQRADVETFPQQTNAGEPSQGRQPGFMRAENILPLQGESSAMQVAAQPACACRGQDHPSQVLKEEPDCTVQERKMPAMAPQMLPPCQASTFCL